MANDQILSIGKIQRGNSKLGPKPYHYSKTPGLTCPGESDLCSALCYAKRDMVRFSNTVPQAWKRNTEATELPTMPDSGLFRIHVAGDFDTISYIAQWRDAILSRPNVWFWAYTRSWRVPSLLAALEELRALPNMTLFASMDSSIPETPPQGWRIAYMGSETDAPKNTPQCMEQRAVGTPGKKPNCQSCGFCWRPGLRGSFRLAIH
jgi:hypothetical protein